MQEWALRDGLGGKNVTTSLTADTTRYSFGRGPEHGVVELVYESNIGHDWASTILNSDNEAVGHHVATYNATPIILKFFDAHSLSLWETFEDVV